MICTRSACGCQTEQKGPAHHDEISTECERTGNIQT